MRRTNAELVGLWGRQLVEDVDLYLDACEAYGGELSTQDRAVAAWVWQHLRERAEAGSRVLADQE